jgi:hypothetical protein
MKTNFPLSSASDICLRIVHPTHLSIMVSDCSLTNREKLFVPQIVVSFKIFEILSRDLIQFLLFSFGS